MVPFSGAGTGPMTPLFQPSTNLTFRPSTLTNDMSIGWSVDRSR